MERHPKTRQLSAGALPLLAPSAQGRLLTYEMVTGEPPGEDQESPAADEITLQKMVTQEAFFVDFLRTDEHDEDGVSKKYYVLVMQQ